MSLMKAPPKAEVMGWDPHRLADYMKRLKLSGCDRVVLRRSISGAQFLNMTKCDLNVFPSVYFLMIAKMQSEINKEDQKKACDTKSKTSKCPKPAHEQLEEVWDVDKIDDTSDLIYEVDDDDDDDDDDYMFDTSEQETAESLHHEEESPPSLPPPTSLKKPPPSPQAATLQQREFKLLPRPPVKVSASTEPSRSRRPVPGHPSRRDDPKPKGSTAKAGGSTAGHAHTRPPQQMHVPNRERKHSVTPPGPAHPNTSCNSMAGAAQGLDPRWYRGKLTRHQGEAALRQVNKDGAFMVRDSSKGCGEHRYTLMLLNKDKVYNIKICNQGDSYYLGNGIKHTKSFPGVTEMITHHTHSPLPLNDATDPTLETMPLCCLLHPAEL